MTREELYQRTPMLLRIALLGILVFALILILELIPLPGILRPRHACIGLRCTKDEDCGTKCTCALVGDTKSGHCVAK